MSDITDPRVSAALERRVDELDVEEREMLEILLDPDNDPWGNGGDLETRLEELAISDDLDGDNLVAGFLREHLGRKYGLGAFEFDHIRDGDHTVGYYQVSVPVMEAGLWLSWSHEIKYLDHERYEVTGLRAAIHVGNTLMKDWLYLRNKALAAGILRRNP